MTRERIGQMAADILEEHPEKAGAVEPYVFDDPSEIVHESTLPFPIITDELLSDQWEEVNQDPWFVDSSGFGKASEPAITIEQFREQLLEYVREHPDHGFGLSGVGPFQVHVSAYQRIV